MIGFGLTIFMGTSFGSLATFYPLFDRASEVLEIHQIRLQGDIENQQQELEQLQKDINFAKKRKEILELRKAKPLKELNRSINMPES